MRRCPGAAEHDRGEFWVGRPPQPAAIMVGPILADRATPAARGGAKQLPLMPPRWDGAK